MIRRLVGLAVLLAACTPTLPVPPRGATAPSATRAPLPTTATPAPARTESPSVVLRPSSPEPKPEPKPEPRPETSPESEPAGPRDDAGREVAPEPPPTPEAAEPTEAPPEAIALEPAPPAPTPPISVAHVDESGWADRLLADFPSRAAPLTSLDLNREGGGPATIALGFNVPAVHKPVGFVWNEGDRDTDEWYPQGLGGFARGGRRWLAISWYAKDLEDQTSDPAKARSCRGARVTLADVTDPANVRYRHLLLVQDAANAAQAPLFRLGAAAKAGYTQGARFAPVPVHAGGVEVVGHYLYVVDTQLGVRIFDLDKAFTADADPGKAACGVDQDSFKAFDYRYAVPQVGHARIRGAAPYSCLAYDDGAKMLWIGQYLAPGAGVRPQVTGFPLASDGRLGATATAVAFPRDKGGDAATRVQGAFRSGNRTWMALTGQTPYKGSTARLALYEDGRAEGSRWRWPHGAEDLYYDPASDRLWCLTEHPRSRFPRHDRVVFGVELATYAPPGGV